MKHTVTKVWNIDNQLVVADTIEEAIALMRSYMGNDSDYRDWSPRKIEAVYTENCMSKDYVAIVRKEDEVHLTLSTVFK